MASSIAKYASSQEAGQLLLLVIGLVVGFAVGGDIQGQHKSEAALRWAVGATADCEDTYVSKGYASVSECLEFAVWEIQDEIRSERADEARAAGR